MEIILEIFENRENQSYFFVNEGGDGKKMILRHRFAKATDHHDGKKDSHAELFDFDLHDLHAIRIVVQTITHAVAVHFL